MASFSIAQILLSVGGAIGGVLFLLYLRRIGNLRVDDSARIATPEFTFIGGATWLMSWWPLGATWPFAKLEVFSWGLRIGPSARWVAWLLPTTEVRWSDITSARMRFLWGLQIKSSSFRRGWVSFNSARFGFARIDERLVVILEARGVFTS